MSEARRHACDILRRLREAGHEACFAGGCVRDELLGLDPKDYDIATDATPDEVQRLFRRTREVGKSFGVVLVQQEETVVEVATFRSEGPYTDKRRPDAVTFSDARTDARRRDFTINALFLDPLAPEAHWSQGARGRVVDYVGGLADLEARLIRAVGEPHDRLDEDHLRALRAVRFAARYDFEIEAGTREAIRQDAAELQGVSRERIGDELRRMLLHPRRADAIELLERLGLAPSILMEPGREAAPVLMCLRHISEEAMALGEVDLLALGLAAWAVDRLSPVDAGGLRGATPDLIRSWRRALCLTNEETDALRATLEIAAAMEDEWGRASVARRKRLAARAHFQGALRLVGARDDRLAGRVAEDVRELGATPGGLAPEPLITGDDLIEMGLRPGPGFRALLDAVYDAQLEGRVRTRADALEMARRLPPAD